MSEGPHIRERSENSGSGHLVRDILESIAGYDYTQRLVDSGTPRTWEIMTIVLQTTFRLTRLMHGTWSLICTSVYSI